ncbi:phage tail assembly protein [Kaistia sp. MMO-174]|uniref:phage tail assembly protein n=1 Tax=Kaistia sp. MMO-174 TaxID=3081256 RepID=UPI003017AD4E
MSEKTEAAEAAAEKLAPAFDREAERFETVPLDWPVTIDGVRYESVTVRRMTVGEIGDFLLAMAKSDGERLRFPMYDVSDAVLERLDADDGDKIEEAVQRFLPRRFRTATV